MAQERLKAEESNSTSAVIAATGLHMNFKNVGFYFLYFFVMTNSQSSKSLSYYTPQSVEGLR
jgi:hypothetical protein